MNANPNLREAAFRGSGAFTLIELLVIIAIIAILSSFLLSGLSAAKARGEKASRQSQVWQLGIALQLYVADSITTRLTPRRGTPGRTPWRITLGRPI
jgi:type II secretory pathway pseudopilin PulG